MTRARALLLALVCTLAALVAGLWLGGHPNALPERVRSAFVDDDRAVRAEIIEKIRRDFYRPVSEQKLEEASLQGIVRSLGDRFSHYLTPVEAQRFQQAFEGEFEGVGMSVEKVDRGLMVLAVFEGSPAERAGIRKGDVVTKVNGESIAGQDTDVAVAKIKGEPGTSVTLTIAVSDTKRERTLTVKRARIQVPIADGKMRTAAGRKLGIARLTSFTSGAHGKLREEIDKLLDAGAQGILLDLRGNGGGLLQEAVLVSSIFVEDGLVVSTDGRARPRREYEAQGGAIRASVPVVVLVDGGSASASEIVTGALRDRKRATVVGTKTFGKGVFQEVEPLSNNGALDLTVGEYFLPSGENIGNKGITPPIDARDLPRTRRDEAMPVALRTLAGKVR